MTASIWSLASRACVALSLLHVFEASAGPRPFVENSLGAITRKMCSGRPLALAIWSLDCAYCKENLQRLSHLRASPPGLRLVLVQADAPQDGPAGLRFLRQAGIQSDEIWVFGSTAVEPLRFAIDPEWMGELPRTYLYDRRCSRVAVSGRIDDDRIRNWLHRP